MAGRSVAALALVLPGALLAAGCVIGAEKTRYSRPSLPDTPRRFQDYVGEVYVLPRVDLQVEAGTAHTKSLMLFPVPWYFGEPKHGDTPTFSVSVHIIAKQDGLVFQPQSLAYLPPQGSPRGPVSMVGPRDCGSQQPPPAPVTAPLPAFALTQGRCYRLRLEIAGPTPDTTETFGVAPGTLLTPQGPEPLPVVRCAENTRYESVAIP